jgi:hypothetical protein
VVGASSGLPHCILCGLPLRLVSGKAEEWVCAACGARHPGKDADMLTTDRVLGDCLRDFLAAHPGFGTASGLVKPSAAA